MAADEEAAELVELAPDEATLERWCARREAGEPFAWITGRVSFCGRQITVTPGTYVPRHQSEPLARRAARALATLGGAAADLCTGSGALAAVLAAAVPSVVVVGVDCEARSVACARRNGVAAVQGDLGAPLASGAFAVVTAVAPYVPTGALGLLDVDSRTHEPPVALDGGPDGLEVVRRVVADASRLLVGGGRLFLEVGGDQDRLLRPDLAAAGFSPPVAWYDEDGELRGLEAVRLA